MLHTMPSGRCDAFNKGSRNGSFGCVNLPDEVLNYMAKNYSANDSSRAKLKHYDKTFDSYLKYNTGY